MEHGENGYFDTASMSKAEYLEACEKAEKRQILLDKLNNYQTLKAFLAIFTVYFVLFSIYGLLYVWAVSALLK